MQRRSFLVSAPAAALARPAATKRDRMLAWLSGQTDTAYTPAAFFLHFGTEYKNGSAAARRHLDYFRQTEMDFLKIQFEQTYEPQPFLKTPADWAKLELRKIDFYAPLIQTVKELVKSAKKDALLLMTLYSPFMCAGHCATSPVLKQHLEENPEAVKKGLEILTESQLIFVRACIQEGIDGFYMSTQGSEKREWANTGIFPKYIKPFDLVAMKEIERSCRFNILHVCDYVAPYATFEHVLDYPGHVVNCASKLNGRDLTPKDIVRRFKRPFMGGLDRHGVLAKGTPQELDAEIRSVIKQAPAQFILAADCTVAGDTDWNRLRNAIALAHRTGSGLA